MKDIKYIFSTPDNKFIKCNVNAAESEIFDLCLNGQIYQEIKGFGGCFNELGEIALSYLSEEQKCKILNDLFSNEDGCNFNICRLPIGASDYASVWYSHNDTENDYKMEQFSIKRDQKYLIPYIKEGIKRRKDMILFASPWSPPAWMKTSGTYNHGSLIWNNENLKTYALYLMKFIESYAAENITINQIHIQNEPMADQIFPSCLWTGEQLRDFIKLYLGPLFKKNEIKTEIWLGTLNCPYDDYGGDEWQSSSFQKYAFTVLTDDEARKYISGVGYQWGGKHAISQTYESFPEIKLMQTENECGDGKNTWEYAEYIFDLIKHYFKNGVEAYTYWNMILPSGGKSTWGWKQNSLISIDQDGSIRYNPEYYLMKHFSSFIKRDAHLLGTKGHWSANSLVFANPDGSIVTVVKNSFDHDIGLTLNIRKAFTAQVKAKSINTFVIYPDTKVRYEYLL